MHRIRPLLPPGFRELLALERHLHDGSAVGLVTAAGQHVVVVGEPGSMLAEHLRALSGEMTARSALDHFKREMTMNEPKPLTDVHSSYPAAMLEVKEGGRIETHDIDSKGPPPEGTTKPLLVSGNAPPEPTKKRPTREELRAHNRGGRIANWGIACPVDGCSRKFTTRGGTIRHLREYHRLVVHQGPPPAPVQSTDVDAAAVEAPLVISKTDPTYEGSHLTGEKTPSDVDLVQDDEV